MTRFGAPVQDYDPALIEAVASAVASVKGIAEAYLAQMHVGPNLIMPPLLVIVPGRNYAVEQVGSQLRAAIEKALQGERFFAVVFMTGLAHELASVRRHGRRLFRSRAVRAEGTLSLAERVLGLLRSVVRLTGVRRNDREARKRELASQRLLDAVAAGQLTGVEAALAGGADVNSRRKPTALYKVWWGWVKSEGALDLAASQGRIEIVRILLDHCVSLSNPHGTYAWLAAAYEGHDGITELLEQRGVLVELQGWQHGCLEKRRRELALWHGDCSTDLAPPHHPATLPRSCPASSGGS